MKYFTLLITLCLFSNSALAQLFGFDAGLARWHADTRGDLGYFHSDIRNLGIKDDWQGFYYASLQHPLMFLPNIKLQRTRLSHESDTQVEGMLNIGQQVFTDGESISLDLNLSHTDLTLYYSFLDNWVNVDVGITVRKFDGGVGVRGDSQRESRDIDDWVPAIYGQARFDIPFSGWSLGGEGHIVTFDQSQMVDLRAMVGYLIDPIFGVGFELGYRYLQMDLERSVPYDITYSGPYASVIMRF